VPRSPEQNERVRAERREQILRAARRRFAVQGYVPTRVVDIAADAGIAQGLLYHYFPNKEALFDALIADALARLNAAVEGLEGLSWTPAKKISQAMAALVHALIADESFALTILLIAQAGLSDATPAATQATMRRERDRPYVVMARIFAAGQRDGTLASGAPDALAVTFWTLIKGLALHKAAWGEAFVPPDVDLLLRPFLPPAPEAPHD